MDSISPFSVWLKRGILMAIAILIVLIHLLPLQTMPRSIPAPDLLTCLIFAVVLRRPDYMTIPMIAGLYLLIDMFFMRPPGLGAALTVIGAEVLRTRGQSFREMPFSFEWFLIAAVFTAIALANQIILGILVVERPALTPVTIQLFLTILVYPAVVTLCRFGLRIRRPTPGELDAVGQGI